MLNKPMRDECLYYCAIEKDDTSESTAGRSS